MGPGVKSNAAPTVEVCPVLHEIVDVPMSTHPVSQFDGEPVWPVKEAVPLVMPRPTQPLKVADPVIVAFTSAGLPCCGSGGESVSVKL